MTGKEDHTEGPVARAIENQTARLPSDLFLWSGLGALGAAAFMQYRGRREKSQLVGMLAPVLLILGLYNKVVKVAGSDRIS